MIRSITFSIILVALFGCVSTPNQPFENSDLSPQGKGAYILCEGLQGQNNSSLYRYSFEKLSNLTTKDYFNTVNPTLQLGDIANFIVKKGDTAYVAVTVGGHIEILRISTGKWINRIILNGNNRAPREIAIVNDSIGYITDLHSNSLTQFNPTTFQVIADNISVGYAPEGIVATGNYVFTANSGFGDYAYDHAEIKAHSISVVEIKTNSEIAVLPAGINVQSLRLNSTQTKFYALYTHLPRFEKDSLGGIIEYDALTFNELQHWKFKVSKNFGLSFTGDTLLFLNNDGLYILNTKTNTQPKLVAKSDNNEHWYSVTVSPFDGNVWICNAKGYTTKGEVQMLNPNNNWKIEQRISVGVNPNTIIFFDNPQ